jgi:hypothetical protein
VLFREGDWDPLGQLFVDFGGIDGGSKFQPQLLPNSRQNFLIAQKTILDQDVPEAGVVGLLSDPRLGELLGFEAGSLK